MPRPPIPVHAFFEQAVLEGEVGHDLLQRRGLPAEILHLAGRRGARRISGQPPLASLEELLGPAVIHEAAIPSRRHSSEMFSSPRNPSSTMRIFSSAEYCRRSGVGCALPLVLPAVYPARISVSSSLLAATMNQKSSLREVPQFVSRVLTVQVAERLAHFDLHQLSDKKMRQRN
jgi:hypothetical protein